MNYHKGFFLSKMFYAEILDFYGIIGPLYDQFFVIN